jgi:AraC-like DNA-binding protein
MNLCEAVARRRVIPIGVELIVSPEFSDPEYEQIFGCPVSYGADADRIHFNRVDTEQALPGSVPEVLDASDDIADRYLEALDAASVASQVRRQLIQMLPSGRVDQESVAKKLYRSRATLQRQLGAEGTNFRNILDSTRRNLAERYLREGELSQVEVAYLTGFADQSNFAKAFKRWSGLTPGAYRQEFRQPSDLAQEPQRSA